jgi:signal transduction histidine kinase
MAAAVAAGPAREEPERRVALSIEAGLSARGNARMIEAVLRNLPGNACKYTSHTAEPGRGARFCFSLAKQSE